MGLTLPNKVGLRVGDFGMGGISESQCVLP
jgi:hypothetical protein